MTQLIAATAAERKRFARALIAWFQASMRPLPWRRGYSPYEVWISEMILQQTQMERGITYFTRWMERFPSLAHVAAATEEELLKAWEGLGYYARVRNLHAAAKTIMADYNGIFPCDIEKLRSLPGIGPYTAGAIASIAFQLPAPAVDANAERVFARLCDIDTPVTAGVKRYLYELAATLMPTGNARAFTQALMELGALVCGRTPRCELCPVPDFCEARRLGVERERPVSRGKKRYVTLEMATGVIWQDGKVFIQKRPPYGVWAGLWEFPGGCLEEDEKPEQAVVRELAEELDVAVRVTGFIATLRHSYMSCRVTMHGYSCVLSAPAQVHPVLHAATEGRWVTPEELAAYTFPAGQRKLIEHLRGGVWAGRAAQQGGSSAPVRE